MIGKEDFSIMDVLQKERDLLIRRVYQAICDLKEGEDAAGVLSRIYRQNLEDKTPAQGELMAQEVLEKMGQFEDIYDDALEDPENCILRAVSQYLTGISESEREQIVRRVSRWIEDGSLFKEQELQPIPDEEMQDRLIAEGNVGEEMLKAVTAMVIYTMAKNGDLTAPKELTLSQTVTVVCTEYQLRQLQYSEKAGFLMDKDKNKRALYVAYFVMALAAAAIIAGVTAMGVDAIIAVALSGYCLLWITVVLTAYYQEMAALSEEEAKDLQWIEVPLHSPQTVEEKTQEVSQKHLPWEDTTQADHAEQRVTDHPNVKLGQ